MMRQRNKAENSKRTQGGSIGGYVGFVMGLLGLLTNASEGTPFSWGAGAFLVLGFMIGGYAVGWLIGPAISKVLENS